MDKEFEIVLVLFNLILFVVLCLCGCLGSSYSGYVIEVYYFVFIVLIKFVVILNVFEIYWSYLELVEYLVYWF